MALVPVSISYSADIDRARDIVLKLARRHPEVREVVGCPVVNLGASSVDLSLRVWCTDMGTAFTVKFDLLEGVKRRFDREGIEIPHPYTNVVLHRPSAARPTGEPSNVSTGEQVYSADEAV